MPLCTICNKTQQRGLSHAGLAVNYYRAAPNSQRFHEPTEQMSFMFTANHDAGVVQAAVLESLGPVVRQASNWDLPAPGEFGYAHRVPGVTRRIFEIGPLLGMAQSLLTDPECKPADISIVDTARPGSEGLMSRANRAASGPHWDAAGSAIPTQPYAPG